MNNLLLSLAIILLLSGGVFAQDWAWKTFSPPSKAWSISAPGAMLPDQEAQESGSKVGSYAYSDFYGYFAVVYRDSKLSFWSLKPDYSSYYEKVRNDFIKANNGQLLKEEKYVGGKSIGRDVQIKIPVGQITGLEGNSITKYRTERIRMFFVGKRFYLLLAVLPEDIINTAAVDNYFNSFTTNTAPDVVADSYSTDEDSFLSINAGNGVLSNDSDEQNDRISIATETLTTQTTHGILKLNADGSFVYSPEANFNGQDSFTYKATDGQLDSLPVTVTIKINPVNDAPTLGDLPPSSTLDELTTLTFGATANDIDNSANSLRFSLSEAPQGATIDPVSGVFKWTPSEAQAPANYTFRVNVSDGSATTSKTVNVTTKEVNIAPRLSNVAASANINELSAYTFTAAAADIDIPVQTLTFSLIDAPAGASINPSNGAFSWTPTEAQGNNSTYNFAVRVSDGVVNTDLPIKLTALEVNSSPILPEIAAQTIDELKPLSLTANGSDTDIPVNTLTYLLGEGAPSGMTIDSKIGAISWTPTEAQGAGDYSATIRVTDNGSPNLSVTRTFKVHVNEVNLAPELPAVDNKSVDEETSLTFAVRAADADLPSNNLTFSLKNAPSGATINPTTGAFSWIPNEAQGTGDYLITIAVNDNGSPNLSATRTFSIHVNEINLAPKVSVIGNKTIDEETPLTFTVEATDADLPKNTLTFSLQNAPVGASINPSNGVFTWTPNESQGAGDYPITIVVTDNGSPSLSATQTVNIHVNEVNIAPRLNAIGSKTIDEETPLKFTVSAADADLPANTLTYSLKNAPADVTFNPATNEFKWTPTEAQGPGSYTISFRVTDNGAPALSAEETVTITVKEVNISPTADNAQLNTNEDAALSFVLKASDVDLPSNNLTYSIVAAPVNGTLSGTAPNLTYTPKPDFNGADSLIFKVNDGKADSKTAMISIKIAPVNDVPQANSDTAATQENTPVIINVTANDTDIDGDKIVLSDVSEASGGTVEIINNQVRFTPNQNFRGAGSFKYKISDGNGGTAVGSVSITVNPSNKDK
jgi:VCBS repeat-containing protein